jgi:hypothetical protein
MSWIAPADYSGTQLSGQAAHFGMARFGAIADPHQTWFQECQDSLRPYAKAQADIPADAEVLHDHFQIGRRLLDVFHPWVQPHLLSRGSDVQP